MDGVLRPGKSDTIRFQLLSSVSRYPDEMAAEFPQNIGTLKGYAATLFYWRETRSYGWKMGYEDFSPDFRADLGFVPRVNYRKGIVGANYTYWGKQRDFLTRFEIRGDLDQSWDHDGNLLEGKAEMSIEVDMPLQSLLLVSAGRREKVVNSVHFKQNFLLASLRIRPTGKLAISCFSSFRDAIDFQHIRAGKFFKF
ncbi:MAG: hypothetical protein GY940_25555, partial [bacterium]|nr:hypothetical protein [bacterium]